MKITDLDMQKQIDERLAGVQQRKEALQKFVAILTLEEEHLLALQKAYRDNKHLYDLIEDEQIPEIKSKETSKDEVLKHNSQGLQNMLLETETPKQYGEMPLIILTILEEYKELRTNEIFKHVRELKPNARYDHMTATIYNLVNKGEIVKVRYATYAYNKN
jgi:hypothetical protein